MLKFQQNSEKVFSRPVTYFSQKGGLGKFESYFLAVEKGENDGGFF
jgi:hypothetical protein